MKIKDQIDSFPFEETIGGVTHNYRITQNAGHYGVEQDGIIIAEVVHDEKWKQLSGEPLSAELLDSICEHVEAHYA